VVKGLRPGTLGASGDGPQGAIPWDKVLQLWIMERLQKDASQLDNIINRYPLFFKRSPRNPGGGQ